MIQICRDDVFVEHSTLPDSHTFLLTYILEFSQFVGDMYILKTSNPGASPGFTWSPMRILPCTHWGSKHPSPIRYMYPKYVKHYSDSTHKYSEVKKMLESLIDNIYIVRSRWWSGLATVSWNSHGHAFCHFISGIKLVFLWLEAEFIEKFLLEKKTHDATSNSTIRYTTTFYILIIFTFIHMSFQYIIVNSK